MIFETERLVIRKLHTSDIKEFYDMQNNPKVMQYIKDTMNRHQSELELKRFIDYYTNDTLYYNIWAVEEKKEQILIGICGVYKNIRSEYEIAYRLRESYWQKGFGKEIAKSLINYCFLETNIDELTAYVRTQNKGSISILEKEMQFVSEFYCEKASTYERVYKLKKKNWVVA
ncbi:GNAT family N-acetyltransferase [Aquimarina sp. 2201CG1-2-11]|uniref:GNAT family N-acetyltransferase n=1 Tax=Aquimarina discodermiae TaxID=3231043 RepID=UPI003461E550